MEYNYNMRANNPGTNHTLVTLLTGSAESSHILKLTLLLIQMWNQRLQEGQGAHSRLLAQSLEDQHPGWGGGGEMPPYL